MLLNTFQKPTRDLLSAFFMGIINKRTPYNSFVNAAFMKSDNHIKSKTLEIDYNGQIVYNISVGSIRWTYKTL